jgi:hypothetical protein
MFDLGHWYDSYLEFVVLILQTIHFLNVVNLNSDFYLIAYFHQNIQTDYYFH